MNKIFVLLGFTALVFVFSGCQRESRKISEQPYDPNAIWDGTPPVHDAIPDFFADAPVTNKFPESIVGVWDTRLLVPRIDWSIKFEPDGSIKKIFHSLAGNVNVEEGGVDGNVPGGSYYVFVMGPCEARYIPDENVIKVKIIVDYFLMKVSEGQLEGRIEDYFEGPVSEDGKTWKAEWRNFNWIKGASPPDINLIMDNPVSLVFVKSDPNDSENQ